MKINNILFFLFLLVVQIASGQKAVSKEILGQVFEQSTQVEGVNIINNTTQVATVSDENGKFSMMLREGDVLVFSAVNLNALKYRITVEDLSAGALVIRMTAKEVELKEVVVNENANITAENLGIIPRGQKKYTPAERKIYTATSTSVDKVLNAISGRTSMLKKEAKVEKKEMLFRKLEYLFEETYYTERLKIPSEHIKGFQLYCVDNPEFSLSLDRKNKTMSMFLITGLAQEYLTIIEHEK